MFFEGYGQGMGQNNFGGPQDLGVRFADEDAGSYWISRDRANDESVRRHT